MRILPLILFTFGSIRAASAALLVGNIGSPSSTDQYSFSSSPDFIISSYFTTGSTPWQVDEVVLPLKTNTAGSVTVGLTLWSSEGGEPGSIAGTFGSQVVDSETYSEVAFAPTVPLELDASTSYWVSLHYLSGTAPQIRWAFTLSSAPEAGGEPGATIPATNNYAISEDGGLTWDLPGWEPQIFRVTGTAVPEPSGAGLLAACLVLVSGIRRRC